MTSPFRVHGIPNCDTVKKARAWLDAHGVAYEFTDFKKQPPAPDTIARWCRVLGHEAVLNRRGTTWRKLEAAAQARAATPDGVVALLADHPSAIKRPVVEAGDRLLIGFDAAAYEAAFGR